MIDKNEVREGDTVTVRFQSDVMKDKGIAPIEFTGEVYGSGHGAAVGNTYLSSPSLTVLKRESDWRNAHKVEDCEGDVWVRGGDRWFLNLEGSTVDEIKEYAPFKILEEKP